MWAPLLYFSKDLDVGFTVPRFLFGSAGDPSWVQCQRTAVIEAFEILGSSSAAVYFTDIRMSIRRVIFGDTGKDKYEHRLGYVFVRCKPGITDDPIYLASRLVQLSSLMASSNAKPSDAVYQAYKRQLEFLALLPNTEPIRSAILEWAHLDGIEL
jgi:hypothetical protein